MNIKNETDVSIFEWNSRNVGDLKIRYVDALELFTKNRIDLVAKYKYVEMYDRGLDIPFIRELYKSHISAFSAGTFIEEGQEEKKNSIEDYERIFKDLIDSIKCTGFDEHISVVPVGGENVILNGSHRVAIAAYFGLKVPVVYVSDRVEKYDISYFSKRFLDQRYLDYLMTEYIKLKKDTYVGIFWPVAKKEIIPKAISLLKEKDIFISCEEIELTYQGLFNFMVNVYGHQSWIGSISDGYKGISKKVDPCYKENMKSHVFFLENTSLSEVQQIKARIRDLFEIGNHSVHICDNHNEAVQIVNLLLNENSLHALNYANICKEKQYIKRIMKFKTELCNQNMDLNEILIDSSGVLGLYGLRNPSDIDYLSLENHSIIVNDTEIEISSHDSELKYYGKSKEELILDPNNFLYAFDLKFISLNALFSMKKNRCEPKDKEDCLLISTLLEKKTVRNAVVKKITSIRRRIRYIFLLIRKNIIYFLKKIGLFSICRKIYHNIIRKKE